MHQFEYWKEARYSGIIFQEPLRWKFVLCTDKIPAFMELMIKVGGDKKQENKKLGISYRV